jgi:hypothetical protein
MSRILNSERVTEYSVEFKVKIIKLTFELDVKAIDISNAKNGVILLILYNSLYLNQSVAHLKLYKQGVASNIILHY